MQLRHKILRAAGVALAVAAAPVDGQERIQPDLIESVEAVLEWYGDRTEFPFGAETGIVVSSVSSNMTLISRHTRDHVEPKDLGLSRRWLQGIVTKTGRSIQICDDYDPRQGLEGLCGISFPWIWLMVSKPVLTEEGEILVSVQERSLVEGPDGEVARLSDYRGFLIERADSSWRARELGR